MKTSRNQILSIRPSRIVLVEDNGEFVHWIKSKIDSFETTELAGVSTTFEGAFEMIEKENPEVVILDLKLPDGNGLNILKKIREANLNITIMVLTLNDQAKNICLKMGADYFFDKSKDTNKFLSRLKNLILRSTFL